MLQSLRHSFKSFYDFKFTIMAFNSCCVSSLKDVVLKKKEESSLRWILVGWAANSWSIFPLIAQTSNLMFVSVRKGEKIALESWGQKFPSRLKDLSLQAVLGWPRRKMSKPSYLSYSSVAGGNIQNFFWNTSKSPNKDWEGDPKWRKGQMRGSHM